MKKLFPYLLILFLLPAVNGYAQQNAGAAMQALRSGFRDPRGSARPKVYWWWLNGYVDRTRLAEELKAMNNAGIGGVDIFEIGFRPDGIVPAGPAFMSDSSVSDIVFAIKEAGKYNMEVGLNLSSSWNAGGSWVKPEHAAKTLYFSKTTIQAGGTDEEMITLPFPEIEKKDKQGNARMIAFKPDGRPVFSKEVAVLAIPADMDKSAADTSMIINISAFFDATNDRLRWKAPAGKWDIYRYVCSNTGEQLLLPSPNSHGVIIDHFDAAATESHFMHFINILQKRLGDLSHTALKNLYLASFEARSIIWTSSLETVFRDQHGYDLYKFLPAVFDKQFFKKDIRDVFKRDIDFTISELMINNHYRKGKEIANKYGLRLISESGGPGPPLHNVPVEAIKALGSLDIPRGEFWINHARYDQTPDSIDLLMLVKEIAATSHIYRRKITELEAFTSFQNWQEGPVDMKPIGDRAFCEGMNRPVIHGFTHNPGGWGYPGIGYYAGRHFNDRNTWWTKARPFVDYLARVSYILQESDFFADVLYYYGDKAPNFATPKNTRFAAGSGYDYEIINTEILLDSLSYKDGWFVLTNGAKFKILAVDDISPDNKPVLNKLEAFRKQGGIITDRQLSSIQQQLKALKLLPDFDYNNKGSLRLDYMKADRPVLDYIHEKRGDADFYFVRNTTAQKIERACLFRQEGKIPRIWHPVNGSIQPVDIYQQSGEQISIPLSFAPYESYFIVFDKKADKQGHYVPGIRDEPRFITNIGGRWQLQFDPQWGGPEKPFPDTLRSWTDYTQEGIRHYSGTVVYTKSFRFDKTVNKNSRIWLDLGKVARVAEVWLNGKTLGITWTAPYRYDITGIVKKGVNDIKIEVVNTWSNRIIGDLTSAKKFTRTNLTQRGSLELTWDKTPLLESGLLGPVTIYSTQKNSTGQ